MQDQARAFEQRLAALRPKLHRYCARMVGSAIDGEDVVQETMLKAIEAQVEMGSIINIEGWLFRIAHNAALDHLRRRARLAALNADADLDALVDEASPIVDREAAAASLAAFMRLTAAQRSSVILMDVLGYSLEEIGAVTQSSIPTVKANLHRGRARLRAIASEPDARAPPELAPAERQRLAAYIDRFNARDFDAIRDMLADDARLELVNRLSRHGRNAVSGYFENYSRIEGWRLAPGFVERRPAVLVDDPARPADRPLYFILLEWKDDKLATIRDFRYATYVAADADIIGADPIPDPA